jgi:hypothetical protein
MAELITVAKSFKVKAPKGLKVRMENNNQNKTLFLQFSNMFYQHYFLRGEIRFI